MSAPKRAPAAGTGRRARYGAPDGTSRMIGGKSVAEERIAAGEPGVSLGGRLKLVRQKSGMSLRHVARELGVSPSFVSQLENGKSQPSVATLYSLTQLLGVSIDELFAADHVDGEHEGPVVAAGSTNADRTATSRPRGRTAPGGGPISRSGLGSPADAWPRDKVLAKLSVTRPGTRHTLEMDSGVIWNQLADNTGAGLDFIEIIYPPHASSTNDKRMLQHAGFEFGYLLEGELEITLGFEVFTLRTGESVGFDSAMPHLLANKTDFVARGIWCVRHGYV